MLSFFQLIFLASLSNSKWLKLCVPMFGSSVLFYWSTCLILCQLCYILFITVTLVVRMCFSCTQCFDCIKSPCSLYRAHIYQPSVESENYFSSSVLRALSVCHYGLVPQHGHRRSAGWSAHTESCHFCFTKLLLQKSAPYIPVPFSPWFLCFSKLSSICIYHFSAEIQKLPTDTKLGQFWVLYVPGPTPVFS